MAEITIKFEDQTEGNRSVTRDGDYVIFHESEEPVADVDLELVQDSDDGENQLKALVNDWLKKNIDETELVDKIEHLEWI